MGARLQKFWEFWANFAVDQWVVQVLKEGYQIPFLNNELPPLTMTPWEPREEVDPSERGGGFVREGSDRDSLRKGSRVLQSAFPGSQSLGGVAPSAGCFKAKQICAKHQVLYGDSADSTGFNPRRGLDDIPGHERCLFPHPSASSVQEISQVCLRGQSISVQSPMFWPQYSPSGVHQSTGPPQQDHPYGGLQDYPVFRRLAGACQVKRGGVESEEVYFRFNQDTRNYNQRKKVSFGPDTVYSIFGDADRHHTFLGFPNHETNRQGIRSLQNILSLKSNACKILARIVGTHVVLGKICPWCEVAHEEVSVLPKKSLEERLSPSGCFDPCASRFERKSCLVVKRTEVTEGTLTSPKRTRSSTFYGRIEGEMGSNLKPDSPIRTMEQEGVQRAYQQVRAEGYPICPKEFEGASREQDSRSIFGQHHSPILYKEARGHKILGSIPSGRRTVCLAGIAQGHFNTQVCSGQEQCGGGHPEQEGQSYSNRMDTECHSVQGIMERVGPTTSRSLCHFSNQETANVFCPPPRSYGSRGGCVPSVMGKSRGIRVSSFCSNQKSDKQIQTDKELSNDPGSSLVATEGVVSRCNRTSGGDSEVSSTKKRSSHSASKQGSSSRTPHSSTNRLETILRLGRTKDFSREVSRRIFGARAKPTNALYQIRWRQYVLWCQNKKLSALKPSVNSLCEFFIYLWEEKKLAVSTIKGFRSVLQSVLRHVNFEVSSNQDISDVIRSFIVERPLVRKETVAWNVDIVLKYLCSEKFEPLSSASLKDLTMKCLFLLALALAKRVSELQALSKEVGFSSQGALVSLTLGFRAKNDNKAKALPRNFLVKDLQQLVGREEERKLCPVRALRAYLERTKAFDNKNRKSLFLAPKDPARAASKNGIAYMLKSLIKEAHKKASPEVMKLVKVKPQEIRAVSTSLAFAHNLAIDSVLEAAQWRSNSVFASYYLKEVALQYEECCSLGPLVVAGPIINK